MAIADQFIGLSEIDVQIKAAEDELAFGPRDIALAEADVKKAEVKLHDAGQISTNMAKQIHTLEIDIDKIKEDINKTKTFQREAKSNKEYQIFKDKIDGEEKKIRGIEDQILGMMEQQENSKAAQKAAQDEVAKAKKELEQEKKEVEATKKKLDAKIVELNKKRQEVVAGIDKEDLEIYERARRSARGKSALAPIRGVVCGACNVKLPSQVINLVMIGKQIINCMSCYRILYVDEHSDTRGDDEDEE